VVQVSRTDTTAVVKNRYDYTMLEEELKLNDAITEFVKPSEITEAELERFLTDWAAHPDHYVLFTARVVKNLSALNVKLLNEFGEGKRFHLVKALCLAVEIAFSMREWEYMLGREDGASYWNNHGLFFSSLHGFIPRLNALQKHVSEIEHGFTGRIIYLEGQSEFSFLELLHLGSRLLHFGNHYFVYGGKGAHQNLVYHIKDKNEKGVRVDLAYDGDSNFSNQVKKLQQQVTIHRVFRFERDFECAFPPEMLAAAITAYLKRFKDERVLVSIDVIKGMLAESKPFVKVVEEGYGVSISKPTLGELLAIELLKLSERDYRVLQGAGSITGTEVSRFLRFVMDWPEEVSSEENAPEGDVAF
jgi:hypothetical protein